MSISKRLTKYPRGAGDIGDIGDIFCKSLKLLDFLNAHAGDISGIFSGTGINPPKPRLRDHRSLSKMEAVRKPMTAMAGFITVRTSHEKNH